METYLTQEEFPQSKRIGGVVRGRFAGSLTSHRQDLSCREQMHPESSRSMCLECYLSASKHSLIIRLNEPILTVSSSQRRRVVSVNPVRQKGCGFRNSSSLLDDASNSCANRTSG
jgi:hypothetical protein